MKPQKIEDIRKNFNKEWLLIAVDEMDKKTSMPLTGRLLAHSPDPFEIHQMAQKSKEPFLMTEFSDGWPKEIAACFYAKIFF